METPKTAHEPTAFDKLLPETQPISGTIVLRGGEYTWERRSGGEIMFQSFFKTDPFSIGQFMPPLSQDEELSIINGILADLRPYAKPDSNGYYAAAAGVSAQGQLFADVNNERYIKNDFAGRGCAETHVLHQMQKAIGEDVVLSRLYLMSGMASGKGKHTFKDRTPGSVGCLCGECRVNFRDHTDEHTRFIMLPTNNGGAELNLNATATHAEMLKPNEAWEFNRNRMYPLEPLHTLDQRSIKHAREGYLTITDTQKAPPPLKTKFPEIDASRHQKIALSAQDYLTLRHAYEHAGITLPALRDYPTIENINTSLVQLIKRAYANHAHLMDDTRNIEITATIIKTDKGEFIPAVYVNGKGWLPSKPGPIPTALNNAGNHIGIDTVYMMTFNDKQIREEIAQWNGLSTVGHALKMPDSAELGRLIKNMKPTDQPTLKIIGVNNGAIPEEEIGWLSRTLDIRQSFGPDFANAKRLNEQNRSQVQR